MWSIWLLLVGVAVVISPEAAVLVAYVRVLLELSPDRPLQ
jgi:hypothetical protein